MKQTKLSTLKKGDFFRFYGRKKVYVFDGGGKVRGFNYTATNDINDSYTTKKDKAVETDFEF